MSKLPKLSGEEVIKILTKKFNFRVSRQKGSHITLIKFEGKKKVVTANASR
jgi:predicted RNA binding protein YcfA (HicA-like mRNA interferase family)